MMHHNVCECLLLAIHRSGSPQGIHFQHRAMVNGGGTSHIATITTAYICVNKRMRL